MNIELNKTIFILLSFLIGIIIGVLLLMLIILILKLINKNNKKTNQVIVAPYINQTELLNHILDKYDNEISQLGIKTKLKKLRNFIKDEINIISSSLYPNSKYPILEIKVKDLNNILIDINQELNITINNIINSPLFKSLWGVYVASNKIKSFFKKEDDNLSFDFNKASINKLIKEFNKFYHFYESKDKNDFYLFKKLIDKNIKDLLIYVFDKTYLAYLSSSEDKIYD